MAQAGAIEPGHLLLDEEIDLWRASGEANASTLQSIPDGIDAAAKTMLHGQPRSSMKEMEEQLIFDTLKQTDNNRTRAAKLLGISVRTLRNKLKLYRERDCPVEA